jgi:hypothetical protein
MATLFGGECDPLGRYNYLSEKLQYKAISDKVYYTINTPHPPHLFMQPLHNMHQKNASRDDHVGPHAFVEPMN